MRICAVIIKYAIYTNSYKVEKSIVRGKCLALGKA